MSFFGMGLTLIVTLCLLYLALFSVRLSQSPTFKQNRLVLTAALLLWLLFLAGRIWGGGHQEGALSVALDVTSMHLLGSLPLMTLSCLAVDGVRLVFSSLRKTLPPWAILSGPALGALLIIAAHIQGLRPPVMTHIQVAVPDLSPHLEGLKVAVVSDTHLGESGLNAAWLARRAHDIQKARPDLILLVGDILERGCPQKSVAAALRQLSAPLGVFAVRGNHDSPRPGQSDFAAQIYAQAGIPLLENGWVSPTPGLVLAGIQDLTRARRQRIQPEPFLQKALENRPIQSVTLLLSHTPWLVEEAAKQGVDLMLSGHTHAGQLWPFNHLVKLRYPYIQGVYRVGSMTLIVSRGAGTWGPRMRLWQRGEIPIITLRSSQQGRSIR